MKFAHEGEELVAINGCLDVEIEAVLELALGDLTALELNEVHAGGVETRHYAEKGSGAVGDVYHNTGAVRAGIHLRLLGYADEAGVVVVAVLY